MSSVIDLRSDTVTRPSAGMRAARAAAEVGDDVFGDDPTVNKLEERVAALLGMEAALYVPSGTMSNQIAVNVHTQPGDELLCDLNCHIYNYEAGGPAILSSVTCRTLDGDFGILDLSQLEDKIRNPDDPHLVKTRMVALENTHNRGGGRIYPIEKIEAISQWARQNGLIMHLDGARLWNAIVATGIPAREWGKHFDTVSVCFSKGLGAPPSAPHWPARKRVIAKARDARKLFSAAAWRASRHHRRRVPLRSIDHHIDRLAEDHRHAQVIAQAIADTPGLHLEPPEVDTNLIWFRVDREVGTAKEIAARLKQNGVLVHAAGPQKLRACTHLDVSKAQAERAAETLRSVVAAPVRV